MQETGEALLRTTGTYHLEGLLGKTFMSSLLLGRPIRRIGRLDFQFLLRQRLVGLNPNRKSR